jgi:hypothetical protein
MRFVLPAAAAFAVLAPQASHADPYKWCAQYGLTDDQGTNCGFVTYGQCRAAISGVGGTCVRNPFYDGRPFSDGSASPNRPVRQRQR